MARTATEGPSISSMFTALFKANPDLLRDRDYDNLKAAFAKAYPGKTFSVKHRQIAANIKSRMRKAAGIRKRGKRKHKVEGDAAAATIKPIRAALLVPLEEHIDECLMLARGVGRDQLSEVIRNLKRARNQLIVMIGEQ